MISKEVKFHKEQWEAFQKHLKKRKAQGKNISGNEFIRQAIMDKIEKEIKN